MPIATKQSLSYDVCTTRLLRQQDQLLKIKFLHVPYNDAAVVRFVLTGIVKRRSLADVVSKILIVESLNNL